MTSARAALIVLAVAGGLLAGCSDRGDENNDDGGSLGVTFNRFVPRVGEPTDLYFIPESTFTDDSEWDAEVRDLLRETLGTMKAQDQYTYSVTSTLAAVAADGELRDRSSQVVEARVGTVDRATAYWRETTTDADGTTSEFVALRRHLWSRTPGTDWIERDAGDVPASQNLGRIFVENALDGQGIVQFEELGTKNVNGQRLTGYAIDHDNVQAYSSSEFWLDGHGRVRLLTYVDLSSASARGYVVAIDNYGEPVEERLPTEGDIPRAAGGRYGEYLPPETLEEYHDLLRDVATTP